MLETLITCDCGHPLDKHAPAGCQSVAVTNGATTLCSCARSYTDVVDSLIDRERDEYTNRWRSGSFT